METKPLLYGLIGFFIGGFIVAVAATTFDKPDDRDIAGRSQNASMSQMTAGLETKSGGNYDKAFIEAMIIHHQGAIEMAKLSASRAEHQEIKQLSKDIISAQESEITQMRQWQSLWGYPADTGQTQMSH